jgi:hypothetical protein
MGRNGRKEPDPPKWPGFFLFPCQFGSCSATRRVVTRAPLHHQRVSGVIRGSCTYCREFPFVPRYYRAHYVLYCTVSPVLY